MRRLTNLALIRLYLIIIFRAPPKIFIQRISDLNGCDYIISQIRLKLIALDQTQPILFYWAPDQKHKLNI